MKIVLAHIAPRSRSKSSPAQEMVDDFLQRATRLNPLESLTFASEAALLETVSRSSGRAPAHLVLCDSSGDLVSSEQFATHLGRLRDDSTQFAFLCIGPADGWSAAARARAHRLISFGRITLPHELARVVLAEQTYRALTILAGHPYHSGH